LISSISIAILDNEAEVDCLEVVCLKEEEACAYDFFGGIFPFFLKYFNISLTSFRDFTRIGGKRCEKKVGFTISFPLSEVWGLEI